ASVADKVDRSLRRGAACECAREFEDSDRAGGVVVRSVVDGIAVYRSCDSEMVEMGGQQNRLGVGAGIFAGQHGNGVVGVARSVLGVDFEGGGGVGREFCKALARIFGDGENAKAPAERASGIGKMRFDCAAFVQAPDESLGCQRWIFAKDRLYSSSICAPAHGAYLCAEVAAEQENATGLNECSTSVF